MPFLHSCFAWINWKCLKVYIIRLEIRRRALTLKMLLLYIAPHCREQCLNIVLENNYKRLQVDEIGGGDAEGAGVPLDVVLHDFAVWIVDQVRVGRVGSSPQILRLKILLKDHLFIQVIPHNRTQWLVDFSTGVFLSHLCEVVF